jgi:hypothetical protein
MARAGFRSPCPIPRMSDTFQDVRGLLLFRFICFFLLAPIAGCILYSDPINEAPEISIVQPERITRIAPAVFTATVNDPDQGQTPLRFGWWEAMGACSPDLLENLRNGAVRAEQSIDLPTHSFHPTLHGTYCVAVQVTDRHGARAAAAVTFETVNLPPAIVLNSGVATEPETTRPLWSTLRVLAKAEDGLNFDPEGDSVGLQWSLTRPDQSTVVPMPCPDSSTATEVCFIADRSGEYTVSIEATDAHGLVQKTETKLTVAPDAPPCIGQFEPNLPLLLRAADATATFAILSVADDGDPFPRPTARSSELRFTWSVQEPGKPFGRLADYNAERFTLPGTYKTGDRVQVRVEVEDRVIRNASGGCSDSDATCGVSATCLQRYTWAVEYRL